MISMSKDLEDKRMSLKEAISKFLRDGYSVTIEGMAGFDPVQAAYEIIRQRKANLTLIADSPSETADMLIGAGLIRKAEVAVIGMALHGLALNVRRAVEQGQPHPIEIEEYSNYAMALRFLAGSMGIPFLPTKSLLGSDIPKYNSRIKIIDDPYTGEPVALVPAAKPDVAVIHVSRADKFGNAQVFGPLINKMEIARAAKRTIITCEEIVSTEEIRRFPNLTVIPFYCVDAVVEVPYCCHPWNAPYYYIYDLPFQAEYQRRNRSREGFLEWLDEWCYSCDSWAEYCKKVGWDRLRELTMLERMFNRIGEVTL